MSVLVVVTSVYSSVVYHHSMCTVRFDEHERGGGYTGVELDFHFDGHLPL